MAVLMTQTLPDGVPVEMLDAVTKEMDVENDPPAGMINHVHHFHDNRVQIVDVWDSQEDYVRFRDARLIPAMMKVAEQQGMHFHRHPSPSSFPCRRLSGDGEEAQSMPIRRWRA
jgi:hypothetical protein